MIVGGLGHSHLLCSSLFKGKAIADRVNFERLIDDRNTSSRRMAVIHRPDPILDDRDGSDDRGGHFSNFQRSGGATHIQPIQYPKAVWIGNVVATHGTFRYWAIGMCTCNVDGAFFLTSFQLI